MRLRELPHIALFPLLLLNCGCGPKGRNVQVAYVKGSVYERLYPGTWETGEIKKCELASGTSVAPDATKGDLLLCDIETWVVWSGTGPSELDTKYPQLVEQAKNQRSYLYDQAKIFRVNFHNSGHDEPWVNRKGHDTFWDCQKTADRIECR